MKVLVLGSTGLLGQAMGREILRRGHNLRTAARRSASVQVDITREHELFAAIVAEAPDIIVNCAALADIEACERDPLLAWQTNARPVSVLAEWSRATGNMIVHVSTDHYFVDGGNVAHDEESDVSFVNEYSRTKFAGEAFALTAPNSLVLRTSLVGIRGWGRPTFAEWAIDVAINDRPATLFSDVFTSSLDVSIFSRAAMDLALCSNTGLFNLAASEVYSKETFVREVASQLGCKLTQASAGITSDHSAVRRARCLGLAVSRAEAKLGYRLPGLKGVVASVLRERTEKSSHEL